MRVLFASVLLLVLAGAAAPPETASEVRPLAGDEAERFLQVARVIDIEPIPTGVTRPKRVTLSDGERTAQAVWKTVDIYRPVMRFADGHMELGFRDCFRHEIAAYELDKLLDLGLVPPTVKRRLNHEDGSLQLWIEDAMTETERMRREIHPPDVEQWNRQIHTVRLVRQLLDDSDFNNVSNVLLDRDFRVWAVDHSRGFRLGKKLRSESELYRFSRSVLAALRRLDKDLLDEHLRPWVTKAQIQALLIRRDLILARAEHLIAEKGEKAVLYP